ncbi:MAG: hypothetical protein HOA57_03085 [Candidatus Magasanikbacteria bacterium]|jgi:hypothetical protein|nr:hypothetical protein [Candidatus Magasanikbacteria bacterium]MBT4315122.1 hypothetical protein [Candidatus Magasanikbacteria bacterium]MBT4547422.1 hypothetical protein [Candidatus Magasanikbacteria bacterium]MBT6819337.1 hypothetical protein [Candidatus Magasanikbacteria bacterium]
MKYLVASLAIAVGAILVIKTEWFIQNFGTSSWAEEHMGTSGGTRLFYKLVGIVIILIAFLGISGLLGDMVLGFFGKLFTF